jgi:hypothetical protein
LPTRARPKQAIGGFFVGWWLIAFGSWLVAGAFGFAVADVELVKSLFLQFIQASNSIPQQSHLFPDASDVPKLPPP